MKNVQLGLRPVRQNSRANDFICRLGERFEGTTCAREQPLAEGTTLYIQWGFKDTEALHSACQREIPYVILDLGLWEDERVSRQSVSLNGLHGGGMDPHGIIDLPPRYHPEIQAWKVGGENVLVCGQLEGDAALRGSKSEPWMRRVAGLAVDRLGLPVQLRPHPKMLERWEQSSQTLSEALTDAALCVTYSSTAGITALMAGVPTVAMSDGSSAWGMASSNIEICTPPGRQAWAHRLSYKDYDLSNDRELDACAEYIRNAFSEMQLFSTIHAFEWPDSRGRR